MRTVWIACAMVAAAAAPASSAQTISAGEFLQRAEPLMKKSKATLVFSGEARRLLRILGKTAERHRARHEADRTAGRPVTTCLPPKGKAELNIQELLAHIRALPPAQKANRFESAFASYTAKKYPCRV